jgi:hypothetical protein
MKRMGHHIEPGGVLLEPGAYERVMQQANDALTLESMPAGWTICHRGFHDWTLCNERGVEVACESYLHDLAEYLRYEEA